MGKHPYIPLYVGDYLKDTRILPLNARGAWVDIILFIWNNPDRDGSITATHEEFSRMVGCPLDEWMIVFNLLKQKLIFDCVLLDNNLVKITSRKIQRLLEISAIRSESGRKGGNPRLLVKQTVKQQSKQDLNQNPEYENEYSIIEVEYSSTVLLSKKISNKLRERNLKELSDMVKAFVKNHSADGKSETEVKALAHKSLTTDCASYEKRMDWISAHAPRVHQLQEQISIREYLQLREKITDTAKLSELLTQMQNWKPLLTKNTSAYLTILNWSQRDGRK